MTFKRNFIDGAIVNEDPITYDVKVVVDRPVLEDTKFVVKSAGIPEGFVDDERFTPAAEVTIPAGAKESDATTWSVTDDFLEADEELGTFPVQLTAELVGRYRRGAGRRSGGCRRCDFDREEVRSPDFPVRGRSVVEEVSDERMGPCKPTAAQVRMLIPLFGTEIRIPDIYLWRDSSLELTIDMKTLQWVAGFDIQAFSIDYLGEYFELSTSEDGENWTPHGELRQAEAPNRGYGSNQLRSVAQTLQRPLCQVGRHEGQHCA